jgi:hypothetical protein
MTEGGCRGDDEGSNCEDVAVGAGAGAAGFMVLYALCTYAKSVSETFDA